MPESQWLNELWIVCSRKYGTIWGVRIGVYAGRSERNDEGWVQGPHADFERALLQIMLLSGPPCSMPFKSSVRSPVSFAYYFSLDLKGRLNIRSMNSFMSRLIGLTQAHVQIMI